MIGSKKILYLSKFHLDSFDTRILFLENTENTFFISFRFFISRIKITSSQNLVMTQWNRHVTCHAQNLLKIYLKSHQKISYRRFLLEVHRHQCSVNKLFYPQNMLSILRVISVAVVVKTDEHQLLVHPLLQTIVVS